MKIKSRTATHLHLTHFGWYYGAIAAVFALLCFYAGWALISADDTRQGLIFWGAGMLPALLFGALTTHRHTIEMDRDADMVRVTNRSMRGTRMRTASLGTVKQAHMQNANTGDIKLFRLVLLFHDQDGWVVTRMFTSGDGTMHAVETINAWLSEAP